MKVVLASKNKHKLVEISKITEKFGFELVLQSELGVDIDVEETGTTFEENSLLKARAVMEATGLPALADDSGIAVDALDGAPGIYSARYGFDESLDDWGRLELLLKNTEHVPDGQRQAQFVCVISFITPDGEVIQARGEIHGELTREPAGENGFGYDPIFYYPPLGKTTAELSPEEKNQVSHRANALNLFYKKMKEAGYADK
jgi:XTP/dITP diphosphohydrolase